MLGYVIAVGSVGLASIIREGFADLLVGVRFAPYYIAVLVTAALGGGRPGSVALALSVAAANYLASINGGPATPSGVVGTTLFLIIAGAMLTLIWLLNHAIDRIWHHAESTRLILESQPAGVIGVDADGKINLVNSAFEQQLGYTREELFDQPIDQLVPMEDRGQHAALRNSYMDHPEPRRMGAGRDLHALSKDGSLLPVEIGLNPITLDGRTGALATVVDISERKNLERRSEILANEISHRARNLLTVVQALALRKLPRDSSAQFMATLATLARTQEVFGKKSVAPLRSIIDGELAVFGAQTRVLGCDVLLTAAAGQDLSLIIHELATNALKYGAFSTPTGLVTIEGDQSQDGMFRLAWTEQGGPPIKATPTRAGFGKKILREIAKGLRAHMTLDYLPEGLCYKLAVSIKEISNLSELPNTSKGV